MSTPASAIGMELVYEFECFARHKPPVEVGAGPYGTRVFFEVIDGEVTGERISGRLLAGGGDWLLVGPDGMGRLDERAQIETHDNAVLCLTYEGVIEINERVQTALAEGTETAYEEQYFRTTPRLETGDERYAWVNQTVFVGQGRIYPGSGVQYRVYRVN